jgi:hypothetical protein
MKYFKNINNIYIRSDYIFSYWIFLWFILYLLKLVPYNPKLIIILGIIEILFTLIYLIVKNASLRKITKFIIINIIIKFIPLLLIYKDPLRKKDIYATVILVLIYLIWMYINDVNVIKVYQKLINSYLEKKSFSGTYFSQLYDIIYNKLFS